MSKVSQLTFLSTRGYEPQASQGPSDLEGLIRHPSGPLDLWSLRVLPILGPSDPAIEWIAEKLNFWLELAPKGEQVHVRTHGWQALWDEGYPQETRLKLVSFPRKTLVEACLRDPCAPCWWLEILPAEVQSSLGAPRLSYFAFDSLDEGWGTLLIGDEGSIRTCEQLISSAYHGLSIGYGLLTSANIDAITGFPPSLRATRPESSSPTD